jgi:hypothetical protein
MPEIASTNSPYNEDDNDNTLGSRLAIQSTPLTWFNTNTNSPAGGDDKTIPYENEFAHDPDTGAIYILTRDPATNKVVPKCHSMTLSSKIQELESSGILDNAMAFAFNREIYKLYFDPNRQTVKAGEDQIFDPSHKYYAIRGTEFDEHNNPVYYTGIEASDGSGNILSYFVDLIERKDSNNNTIMIFSTGHLIRPMEHGKNYIVEFYDTDKVIIRTIPFQAVNVRYLTFDMTPDNAIMDIIAITNYPYEGDSWKCQLHQGQSWRDIGLRVFAQYAGDAQFKDITHESEIGNKLRIEGIENITTTELTSSVGKPQEFDIIYYLSQASNSNPLVDPITLSIKHKMEVYIIPDMSDIPYGLVIGIWKEITGSSTATLCFKVYGLFATEDNKSRGVLRDITSTLKSLPLTNTQYNPNKDRFDSTLVGGNPEFKLTVPYGFNSTKDFYLKVYSSGGATVGAVQYVVTQTPSSSVNPETKPSILWVNTGGRSYMRFDSTTNSIESLKAKYSYREHGGDAMIPTHVTIRNAEYPSMVYADKVAISTVNSNFLVSTNALYPIRTVMPVIVEFDILTLDANGNVLDSRCTGADMFTVQTAAS